MPKQEIACVHTSIPFICSLMEMKPDIVTNGASLQRELSNTDLPSVGVRMDDMKERQQDIEHRPNRCQPSLDVLCCPMMEVFEIANDCHQRQGSLHQHALIPGAFGTELAIRLPPRRHCESPNQPG
jgi:hypothetical protein